MNSDSLTQLKIQNFQSLRNLVVDLGQFTVLVGPSSSGKSAVLRSVRALVRNVGSPSSVSHGQSLFSVQANFEDVVIELIRGKAKSSYFLDGSEYPKAGVKVPVAVANKLRMPPGEIELFLADQFDRPYLLSQTGSSVAKELGDLTNASLLLTASREANVRRQRHASVAKLRTADVGSVQTRLNGFSSLRTEKDRVVRAREVFSAAVDLQGKLRALSSNAKQWELAEKALSVARSTVDEVPEIGSRLGSAEKLAIDVSSLDSYIKKISLSAGQRSDSLSSVSTVDTELESLRGSERGLLRELGQCPVCGQSTEGF